MIEAKRRLVAEFERAGSGDQRTNDILLARRQVEQEVIARVNKQEESHEVYSHNVLLYLFTFR